MLRLERALGPQVENQEDGSRIYGTYGAHAAFVWWHNRRTSRDFGLRGWRWVGWLSSPQHYI